MANYNRALTFVRSYGINIHTRKVSRCFSLFHYVWNAIHRRISHFKESFGVYKLDFDTCDDTKSTKASCCSVENIGTLFLGRCYDSSIGQYDLSPVHCMFGENVSERWTLASCLGENPIGMPGTLVTEDVSRVEFVASSQIRNGSFCC